MANTKKRWTTEEIEILKKHYPTEGDAVFKRLPGRTAKSCRIQASKLKISKNISSAIIQDDRKYIRLWTKAEDEILREYYAEEGSNVRCRLNQKICGILQRKSRFIRTCLFRGKQKMEQQRR